MVLFQNGALVDVLNNTGDTPLHRAAYTGRVVSTYNTVLLINYINLKYLVSDIFIS